MARFAGCLPSAPGRAQQKAAARAHAHSRALSRTLAHSRARSRTLAHSRASHLWSSKDDDIGRQPALIRRRVRAVRALDGPKLPQVLEQRRARHLLQPRVRVQTHGTA
eukprot:2523694-Prymnesium_polylepis.1